MPAKHAVSLNPEVLPENTPEETALSYVDIAALEGGDAAASFSPKELTFGAAPSRARRVLRAGDTILSTVRTYLKAVANFTEAPDGLVASTGFAVLRPIGRLHPRYAYWAALSEPFIENVVAHSEGVSYPAINPSVLGSLHMPVPPHFDQERIANFLDEQTARIDALIAEKQTLLQRVRELEWSQVAHMLAGATGTRLQRTHYEWYPTVSETWHVMPLKHAVEYKEGPGILAVDFRDEGVPLLRVSGVKGEIATLDGCNFLDPEKVARTWSHFRVKRGDLLISASASMGTVSLVTAETEGAVPYTGIIILRPRSGMSREFIRHFMSSDQFMRQIDLLKAGATIQHYGPTHLDKVVIAAPKSVSEQVDVAQMLSALKANADSLLSHVAQHIARLREYRSSLISAAVTGQLDLSTFKKAVQ